MGRQQMIHRISLSCLILLCLSGLAAARGTKYGLFVGVGSYETGVPPLSNAVNDATEMSRTFVAYYGFNPANTELRTNKDATRENIIGSILRYQGTAVAGDLFLFYFSGHGTQFPDKYSKSRDEYGEGGKDSAIVPYDARKTRGREQWRGLILDDEFYDLFKGFTDNGVKVVFISDSCNSGDMAKTLNPNDAIKLADLQPKSVSWKAATGITKTDETRLTENKAAVANTEDELDFDGRYLMISSSSEIQLSLGVNPKTDMSLFSYYLWLKLNEYGQAKKVFTLDTLEEVKKEVKNTASKPYGRQQTPGYDTRFYTGKKGAPIF